MRSPLRHRGALRAATLTFVLLTACSSTPPSPPPSEVPDAAELDGAHLDGEVSGAVDGGSARDGARADADAAPASRDGGAPASGGEGGASCEEGEHATNDCDGCCSAGQSCVEAVPGSNEYECFYVVADCSAVPRHVDGALCATGGGGYGTCCGAACVIADFTSQPDPANCGACGVSCPSGTTCAVDSVQFTDTCQAGGGSIAVCGSSTTCAAGYACANIDALSNSAVCVVSQCSAATAGFTCAAPNPNGHPGAGVCCGASCVDVRSDAANCGGCGIPCASGKACNGAGTCQ